MTMIKNDLSINKLYKLFIVFGSAKWTLNLPTHHCTTNIPLLLYFLPPSHPRNSFNTIFPPGGNSLSSLFSLRKKGKQKLCPYFTSYSYTVLVYYYIFSTCSSSSYFIFLLNFIKTDLTYLLTSLSSSSKKTHHLLHLTIVIIILFYSFFHKHIHISYCPNQTY